MVIHGGVGIDEFKTALRYVLENTYTDAQKFAQPD